MNVNYGKIALVLAAIGAINWALSMHDMNLVSMIPSKQIRTIVYYLIALAGAYLLVQMLMNKKEGFLFLPSCSSLAQKEAECKKMNFKPGTPAMTNCINTVLCI